MLTYSIQFDTHNHPIADAHPSDVSATIFPGQDYNNVRMPRYI